ncbi:hypothetical protein CDL12_19061 [Handroanthus impetiginosus]|uniref:Epidermal patterning factor-like protein n=1 Tax=Handroanthus impetiginosus TaxID=429701 RepID=A0A2G9GTL1_9LAMI|nr:hypothetical protein CDL12_21714 [Handroanthus impetiginosus]PIN08360.1 hypothetical protein CDL12_19061 [Handroanthus impetiginosus]
MKRNRHLIVVLVVFFLISCSNHFHFMAQGRQFPDANLKKEEEMAVKTRVLIGSRPPRCDQRCSNCGHCEAVQVPITPTIKFLQPEIYSAPRIAYSRGDGISNYKPMCWKCKCGDFIFNP